MDKYPSITSWKNNRKNLTYIYKQIEILRFDKIQLEYNMIHDICIYIPKISYMSKQIQSW